jgi:two-component system, NarL family, response regulator LiaR
MRLVIADDNPAVLRQWIVLLQDHFDVIAAARDGLTALEYISRYLPDVAVLDLLMPSMDGLEVTQRLKNSGLPTAVVICSIETGQEFIDSAREAGALGYVFKYNMVRDLILAVRCVARGEPFISSI